MFHVHCHAISQPLLHTTDDVSDILRPKALCWHHLYTYSIQSLLYYLTLTDMRLANKDAVEAHHLSAIGAHNDIFDSSNDFLDDRHLSPAGAWRGVPHCQISQAKPD